MPAATLNERIRARMEKTLAEDTEARAIAQNLADTKKIGYRFPVPGCTCVVDELTKWSVETYHCHPDPECPTGGHGLFGFKLNHANAEAWRTVEP